MEVEERRITDPMNESLVRPFSMEEVWDALFQMYPLKALGPGGFKTRFFQKNWDIVGLEVCKATLHSLNNVVVDNELNFTLIALIPKIKNSSYVTEFRPISLCNVLYKIISKVLAYRLKLILQQIISPYQSAFIPGRLITDNILATYETLHTMHSRLVGKKGYMMVKIDMSKANNKVKWGFFLGGNGENGVCTTVDKVCYDVCFHNELCGVSKWNTNGKDYSNSGYETG
jgi:hypothetical protein